MASAVAPVLAHEVPNGRTVPVEDDSSLRVPEPTAGVAGEPRTEIGRLSSTRRGRIQQADRLEHVPPEREICHHRERKRRPLQVPRRGEMTGPRRVALGGGSRWKGHDLPGHAHDFDVRERLRQLTEPTGRREAVGVDEGDDLAAGLYDSSV